MIERNFRMVPSQQSNMLRFFLISAVPTAKTKSDQPSIVERILQLNAPMRIFRRSSATNRINGGGGQKSCIHLLNNKGYFNDRLIAFRRTPALLGRKFIWWLHSHLPWEILNHTFMKKSNTKWWINND